MTTAIHKIKSVTVCIVDTHVKFWPSLEIIQRSGVQLSDRLASLGIMGGSNPSNITALLYTQYMHT